MLALVFAVGLAVGKYRLFPYAVVDNAFEALDDWRRNWRHYLQIRSQYLLPTERTAGGVTRHDRSATWPGYTFLTMHRDGRFGATLIDLDGRALHTWDIAFSDAFPDPRHLEVAPPDFDATVHGAALFPDGDVILNFSGLGGVRLDRCSRLVWRLPAKVHHSVDVLPDGGSLIPARHKRRAASPRHPWLVPGPSGHFWEDTILRLRPDGSVAEEVSLLDILYDSGWPALLLAGAGSDGRVADEDPTHLNDAEALRPEMAAAFPMFRAGDVLLSPRNLNTILVVDGTTWRVKWSMTGPFLGQHDPDFLPNGHILVFDNRITGDVPRWGYSRILELDPATREIVWSYEGTDQEPFYTAARGMHEALPNGNVLVVEALAGRVFEVARGEPDRIVWEYVNLAEPGFVGMASEAFRVAPEALSFIGQPCDDPAMGGRPPGAKPG